MLYACTSSHPVLGWFKEYGKVSVEVGCGEGVRMYISMCVEEGGGGTGHNG